MHFKATLYSCLPYDVEGTEFKVLVAGAGEVAPLTADGSPEGFVALMEIDGDSATLLDTYKGVEIAKSGRPIVALEWIDESALKFVIGSGNRLGLLQVNGSCEIDPAQPQTYCDVPGPPGAPPGGATFTFAAGSHDICAVEVYDGPGTEDYVIVPIPAGRFILHDFNLDPARLSHDVSTRPLPKTHPPRRTFFSSSPMIWVLIDHRRR